MERLQQAFTIDEYSVHHLRNRAKMTENAHIHNYKETMEQTLSSVAINDVNTTLEETVRIEREGKLA